MTRTLIPAYIPQDDEESWAHVLAMAPGIAILTGPTSGPGPGYIPELHARARQLAAAGWELAWYVTVDRLRRSLLDIVEEVTVYRFWYSHDLPFEHGTGVFFDEYPGPGTVGALEAGLLLEALARRLGGRCILNPGVAVPPRWLYVLADSFLVTFEGAAADYPASTDTPPAPNEAHLVHTAAGLRHVRASWGYCTDDTLPNPWDRITGDPWIGDPA